MTCKTSNTPLHYHVYNYPLLTAALLLTAFIYERLYLFLYNLRISNKDKICQKFEPNCAQGFDIYRFLKNRLLFLNFGDFFDHHVTFQA